MPAPTAFPIPKFATGPGYLYRANPGAAEPAHSVAASVFSDQWPAAWILLGATDAGHTFNYQTTFGTIEFAEFLDPVAYAAEGRTGSVVFGLGSIDKETDKIAFNGGTVTTTGATADVKMSKYDPPTLGQEVRCLLGWESQDFTERYVWRQCIQTGQVSITRQKGAANRAIIPLEFSLEIPQTGLLPWQHILAGSRA